jgi:hypothetical protein
MNTTETETNSRLRVEFQTTDGEVIVVPPVVVRYMLLSLAEDSDLLVGFDADLSRSVWDEVRALADGWSYVASAWYGDRFGAESYTDFVDYELPVLAECIEAEFDVQVAS